MLKCDVTLIAVRFVVMIVQPPFSSLEVNPFVGCVNGEDVPHVIVRDVVSVLMFVSPFSYRYTSPIFLRVPAVSQWVAPHIE